MFSSWKLKDYVPGAGAGDGASGAEVDTTNWIDIAVPGDVYQALVAAGRIEDPFYDRNELACAWVEQREWWYRTDFDAAPAEDGEQLRLVFHGLDTFATIWLNGVELGQTDNMFRTWSFDITGQVLPGGSNTLALRFDPPFERVRDREGPSMDFAGLVQAKRNLMRKAAFGFGWDWGPRLPTIGVWRPVELRRERHAALQSVRFATEHIDSSHERAQVAVAVAVETFGPQQPLTVALRLTPPDGEQPVAEHILKLETPGEVASGSVTLQVDRPRLWWTHDLGPPELYTLRVELLEGEIVLQQVEQQVGIRTIELDQSPDPDEPGTRYFRFVLNGVPIFAKGACWIPAGSFLGGLDAEHYGRLLADARDANMNMLRIWGGGIYEHDAFYDCCDRLGLLVWQDFMFANAPYPEDQQFVDNVRAELRDQIVRLRNHPGLALWCGNNEIQMMQSFVAAFGGEAGALPGLVYYDRIMPELVRELDGHTPYWPGSPYGGADANSQNEGDVHDWTVWHGLDANADLTTLFTVGPKAEDVAFTRYAEDMGRFISEFGIHASPVYETLRRSVPAEQLYHHSPSMDHHNKDNPKNKVDLLMVTTTGLPRDLAEFIDFSMITQAEGLKFGIEHFRRRRPHCSGTLVWQFNDCWPTQSWSIEDYYGFQKAGYFYLKRAYAPVLGSFKSLDDGSVELWIANDRLDEVRDTLTLWLGTFAGGTVWEEQLTIEAPPAGSRVVWKAAADRLHASPGHYLALRSQTGSVPANRHFFAAIKDLELPRDAQPQIEVRAHDEHTVQVQLTAPAYLFFVHLLVADEHARYDDNYFDLVPGETRQITVRNGSRRLTPEMVQVRWR